MDDEDGSDDEAMRNTVFRRRGVERIGGSQWRRWTFHQVKADDIGERDTKFQGDNVGECSI